MNRHVAAIAGRLSLRPPQRSSLEILEQAFDLMQPAKDRDPTQALEALRAAFPDVVAFDRDFPSLCFALATGVGKTRLMGAFIAYLHLAHGIRHFFVLAPNLTIYDKLIRDFTANTPKYVFQGIAEFATDPPQVITGDNYESGIGVRKGSSDLFGREGTVHVNVFNISKINAEVRGGRSPRMKRLAECLGESYFEYLSALPDLVLLMDESHRYRAQAGAQAINELKPILGLELTATPFVQHGNDTEPFKNVIYDYPLARALDDGFVKRPCVVTRRDFRPDAVGADDLERIKLEDGVRLHEEAKGALDVYADRQGVPKVKPFMLVIARDIEHAKGIQTRMEADAFFGGVYKGRVIRVDSGLSGTEGDEVVKHLLDVERPDDPTEVVIHVNMLKEGWDVTNLYTIVPLRAANARQLVEQSIGRGLRLPYGKRTGDAAVDRLNIVAHDRFREIVEEAEKGDSVLRRLEHRVLSEEDIARRVATVVIESPMTQWLEGRPTAAPAPGAPAVQPVLPFGNDEERVLANATLQVIETRFRGAEGLDLRSPAVRDRIAEIVRREAVPAQLALPGTTAPRDVKQVVADVVDRYVSHTIQIPRIVVLPSDDVQAGFREFDLDLQGLRFLPPGDDILIQDLATREQTFLEARGSAPDEKRLEDHVVKYLIDFDDIDYDRHAELLYKLAGQLVAHLRPAAKDEAELRRTVAHNAREMARVIHAQMGRHTWEDASSYVVQVTPGFLSLGSYMADADRDAPTRSVYAALPPGTAIRRVVFDGFRKALHSRQKFQSDPERRSAVVLETDRTVLKWCKPLTSSFHIHWSHDQGYTPDFVVETTTGRWLCEVKARGDLADPEVLAKAEAARTWCRHATADAATRGESPWSYALIPDDLIEPNMTFAGLIRLAG